MEIWSLCQLCCGLWLSVRAFTQARPWEAWDSLSDQLVLVVVEPLSAAEEDGAANRLGRRRGHRCAV